MTVSNRLWVIIFAGLAAASMSLMTAGCQGPAGPDGDDAVVADSIPPTVVWLAPTQDTTLTTDFDLLVRAHDDQNIWRLVFYVGGHDFTGELVDSASGTYRYRWQVRLFPEGPYPLVVQVWDSYRNRGGTQTIHAEVRR